MIHVDEIIERRPNPYRYTIRNLDIYISYNDPIIVYAWHIGRYQIMLILQQQSLLTSERDSWENPDGAFVVDTCDGTICDSLQLVTAARFVTTECFDLWPGTICDQKCFSLWPALYNDFNVVLAIIYNGQYHVENDQVLLWKISVWDHSDH